MVFTRVAIGALLIAARSIAARSSSSSAASACRPLARTRSVRSADGKRFNQPGQTAWRKRLRAKRWSPLLSSSIHWAGVASRRPQSQLWEAPAAGREYWVTVVCWHRCQPGWGQLPAILQQHGLSLVAGVMGGR